jgi:hypothetical protein
MSDLKYGNTALINFMTQQIIMTNKLLHNRGDKVKKERFLPNTIIIPDSQTMHLMNIKVARLIWIPKRIIVRVENPNFVNMFHSPYITKNLFV